MVTAQHFKIKNTVLGTQMLFIEGTYNSYSLMSQEQIVKVFISIALNHTLIQI